MESYKKVDGALKKLQVHNPNPYTDLWQWHGKWSSEMPSYKERRTYMVSLFSELLETLQES